MLQEVNDALELIAKPRNSSRTTANRGDIELARKTLLLFLENIDVDMTVGDLREHLDRA